MAAHGFLVVLTQALSNTGSGQCLERLSKFCTVLACLCLLHEHSSRLLFYELVIFSLIRSFSDYISLSES